MKNSQLRDAKNSYIVCSKYYVHNCLCLSEFPLLVGQISRLNRISQALKICSKNALFNLNLNAVLLSKLYPLQRPLNSHSKSDAVTQQNQVVLGHAFNVGSWVVILSEIYQQGCFQVQKVELLRHNGTLFVSIP